MIKEKVLLTSVVIWGNYSHFSAISQEAKLNFGIFVPFETILQGVRGNVNYNHPLSVTEKRNNTRSFLFTPYPLPKKEGMDASHSNRR